MFSNYFPVENKLAVISGGSQGVGAAIAKALFARGAHVVVVARNVSKLQETVNEMESVRQNADQKAYFIQADLAIAEDSTRVFQELHSEPDIVMCCAGGSFPGLLIDQTTEDLKKGVDMNYMTALYFGHAALKAMARAKNTDTSSRHIMFFSSVVAFFPFIGYGQYAPLKAAVRSLADIMRHECIPYNIKVECIFPGNTLSEGYLIEEETKPAITKIIEGPSSAITSDECAKLILNKLDRGYEMITTDFIGWVLNTLSLGASPRTYNLFQTIVAIMIVIFGPVWNFFVNRDIQNYYKRNPYKRD
ncbi:3-ketosphinganine reductase, catalyzes the second step in phytosphingosine synthesis [Nadsonia fulvescens var. elongata DSM 6958]|uniref:3-ketodihydrosphingosine reductase TSC10 n=1 Tax=Nadsonia fulvescens var. elongata DSM 6958 TaxID=857566 RepID=A0A1E3PIS8_9ASCO|nr:3-ketosphinganine reductase, catalyzes the second step in phytosphingosine synthesis [Nadsonia fulvescens var. elongata DSM 6958]